MAAGELHMDRIILGAALGIGAIAAAPFTGGGSVLGAATLAGSLSGFGTGLAAATAGLVGAAIADGMADEEEISAYCDGYRKRELYGIQDGEVFDFKNAGASCRSKGY